MPCVQHGRVCAEPPAVVNCPIDGSALAVNRLIGRGGFARVYRVTRLPHAPSHHSHDPHLPHDNKPSPNLLPPAPTLILPPVDATTTTTTDLHDNHDNLKHVDPHQLQNFSAMTTNSHFALKVISKCRLHNSQSALQALKTEVSIHQKLRHPSIVSLLTYWEDAQRVYLLLDLVEGPSLEDYVIKRHNLTENEACLYIAQTLKALSYLHSNLVVHKDIKLANILLSPDFSRVYLCDFGLSGNLDASSKVHHSPVCGTPNYVAPELLTPQPLAVPQSRRGGRRVAATCPTDDVVYTPSVDMWSSGIVLFIMLAGHGPFDSDDGTEDTFRRIRTARFTFPIGLKLSIKAKSFIRSLLAELPTNRLTADKALRHIFFETSSPTNPLPLPFTIDNSNVNTMHKDTSPNNPQPEPEPEPSQKFTKRDRIAYRRTRVKREGSSEYERKNSRNKTNAFRSTPHPLEISLDGPEDDNNQSRAVARPTYARAKSSGPHSGDRDDVKCTDRRKSVGRQRNAGCTESNQGHFKDSCHGPSTTSDVRNDLIYLSLALSAALVKGRKYLEEDGAFLEEVWDPQRAMNVLTGVDGMKGAPPLVRRWLDYTSKYGFATLMEDGHVGCCFNDGSIMFVVSDTTNVPDVAYIAPFANANANNNNNNNYNHHHHAHNVNADRKERIAGGRVLGAEVTTDVSKKACLCTRFAEMMAGNTHAHMHDLPSACNVSFVRPDEDMDTPTVDHDDMSMAPTAYAAHRHFEKHNRDDIHTHRNVVFVREWARMRCGKAAAFRLSNHSIHVKFDVSAHPSRREDGLTHCDDFVFDLRRGALFYRRALSKHAYTCKLVDLAEFSTMSGRVYAQLIVCAQAVSHFLE